MEPIFLVVIIFYMLSTIGYLIYLFLQKDYLQKTGFYLLAAGFLCHTVEMGYRFVQSGHFPVSNLHETLSLAGWTLAGVFLLFQDRYRLKILGIYAAPLITIVMVIAARLPNLPSKTHTILNSFWLIVHVVAIFIGEASLALACGAGLLYLLQENAIKSKQRGFFFKRLPSLELLDNTGYACIVTGFAMLTFGLITGLIYAKSVWGRFWSWDPKEVWSGITWILYAVLLHQRLTVGWRGRRAAIMAIIGFAVILFTFLGVNFFLKGHHGEFTRM
ncbi:MAG: c-type cytochrome biogenesis protein CcsB [Desulfobacteraceae bacterium]|nr:c-type cytochrome biogenesis protein CcsB [Desulfobacteraceae bacterium]MDH3573752.1 c-type cytochrome biogenesis protein CcsB [Desulfobacteraceae bacterium]MDH3721344.1 c-type cytochrome biogenesis protein CcsB [Desulfobacteraceae bacterium]MDH3835776.1 c-type cytochrome biogenesis protein CcsB [Desulfobacteraceae bacterium]MDH3873055.1 c-type cytochrome biogenesis protein CcsB [Desulfobacteraceae bacterium]